MIHTVPARVNVAERKKSVAAMGSMSPKPGSPVTKLLSPEEERALIGRWSAARDPAALDRLVAAHRPLVLKIAAAFRRYGHPPADLIQEGHIGLLEAAHRFDPARDVRFATYARWWIKSAIQEFVLRNTGAVRAISSSRQKSLLFTMARMMADGAPILGPERDRLAKRHGVSPAAVDRMMLRMGVRDVSLDAERGEEGVSLADLLADDRPDPEALAVSADEERDRIARLTAALAALPPRERRIVESRHLREDAPLLRELGRDIGVSKERVRQLERRALSRLKELLSERATS